MQNCTFEENFSELYGIIQSSIGELVQISNSTFLKNTGNQTSILTAQITNNIFIDNTQFLGNHARVSSFSISYSNVELNNTFFDDNVGEYITHGFILINSRVKIAESIIQNSYFESTVLGFFSLLS